MFRSRIAARLPFLMGLGLLIPALGCSEPVEPVVQVNVAPDSPIQGNFGNEKLADVGSNVAWNGDWPEYRGPRRDGKSNETGLLQEWPADGPPLVWEADGLGRGFSSVSILGPRVLVGGTRARKSVVFCLDRADGRLLWRTFLGPMFSKNTNEGPGATPTLEGDRAYMLTANGVLACLDLEDGAIVWRKDLVRDLGGRRPNWGYNESPLIEGDLLIVSPGGSRGTVAALDKATGEEVWRSEIKDPASYAPWIARDIGPHRVLMGFTSKAGSGIDAADGRTLWQYEAPSNKTANASTAIFDDNRVLYSSAYGTGAGMLELTPNDAGVDTREVYFTQRMMNHFGGMILHDGYLYGASNDILTCLEFATGIEQWKNRGVGKCTIAYADGRLYCQTENGNVALVEPTKDDLNVVNHFKIPVGALPPRATPVILDGRLYIRNEGQLYCYDIRDPQRQQAAADGAEASPVNPDSTNSIVPDTPTEPLTPDDATTAAEKTEPEQTAPEQTASGDDPAAS